jgi:hypothetical protein
LQGQLQNTIFSHIRISFTKKRKIQEEKTLAKHQNAQKCAYTKKGLASGSLGAWPSKNG